MFNNEFLARLSTTAVSMISIHFRECSNNNHLKLISLLIVTIHQSIFTMNTNRIYAKMFGLRRFGTKILFSFRQ